MRELTMNERQLIAAGLGEGIAIALGSFLVGSCAGYGFYQWKNVITIRSTYEEKTPIYNTDGIHVGNDVVTKEHFEYVLRK